MDLPPTEQIAWFRRRLRAWFSKNARSFPWREESASEYLRILSEVLLQRTRAQVAADFIPSFIRRYPSWSRIAQARPNDLREHLKPIGLWRRRAASLGNLANEMVRRNGQFPATRAELEELPNVGQYIANAVLLFCYGQRQPLLDVNMARVLERFFGPRKLADIRYDVNLQTVAKKIVSAKDPLRLNWAILDHAATVCRISNPLCDRCPFTKRCKFANTINAKVTGNVHLIARVNPAAQSHRSDKRNGPERKHSRPATRRHRLGSQDR